VTATAEDDVERRATERVGSSLRDKYRLERLLGVGGMAAVYAAVHRNGRRVAVKLLHPELSLHREIRERFLREGQAANKVGHPGAVAVLDDDVNEDGTAFLVMELLEGQNLEDVWMRVGRHLPIPVLCELGIQLLDVLDAAHRGGIVHRDIKPANLFLTREGRLKVLDFGIARLLEPGNAEATHSGTLLGTPAFMAPEQALGKTQAIDPRTDLWSVGATLFSLASSENVHVAETAQETLVRCATVPARSFATALPEAPPELVLVVDRALQFDMAARWPSAEEMRDALRRAAGTERLNPEALVALVRDTNDGPVPATTPSARSPRSSVWAADTTPESREPKSAPRRGRFLPVALGLAVVVVGVGLAWAIASQKSATRANGAVVVTPLPAESAPAVAVAEPTSPPPPDSAAAPSAALQAKPAPGARAPNVRPAPESNRPSRSPASPPAPNRATSSCDPPYRIDASGNKQWKRECL
jgi:eukaryotic-like serine/threonine-protein kinase